MVRGGLTVLSHIQIHNRGYEDKYQAGWDLQRSVMGQTHDGSPAFAPEAVHVFESLAAGFGDKFPDEEGCDDA